MKRLYMLLCLLLLVGCTQQNNNEGTNVTTTTTFVNTTKPTTTTLVTTKEPIELVIGKYVEDAEMYPTIIVLHEDKSVELTLNFCGGMANLKGVYELDDNILTITFINDDTEGDSVKFEIISSNTLQYIPKTYTYNKGDIFSCAYVDVYNLSNE